MRDNDRSRSKRLADYTDQLVLRRRNEGRRPGEPDDVDVEVEALSRLAAELTDLDVAPPRHFQDELAARLRAERAKELESTDALRCLASLPDRLSRAVSAWTFRPTPVGTALAFALLLAILAFSSVGGPPVVSAAEVLARSDKALSAMVRPGEVLKRTWRIRQTTWEPPGAQPVTTERLADEWMDGADFDRVAGQSLSPRGRRRAWASRREHGELHSIGFVEGEGRESQLNIEPTREEYLRAADAFPPDARRLLHAYLNRSFIYTSIAGERRFNREILEGTLSGPLPRSVSVDHITEDGKPAFAVRAVDPSRVVFYWRSGQPPLVLLTRDDTVSYIAKDSYLTIKSQRAIEYRNGRRSLEVRTLEDMRTQTLAEMKDNPFEIDAPPGTRVNQQSALELLTGVLRVLQQDQSQGH